MKKYKVVFDKKHTMWHRTTAEIEANSLKEAQDMLKDDIIDYKFTNTEWLYDTCEYILEKENYVMSRCDDFLPDDNWDKEENGYYEVEEFPEELNYRIKK